MKLTAKAEYGLRCILSLARAELSTKGDPFPPGSGSPSLGVPQIAKSEGLSVEYTGKLIRILRQSGLVKSTIGRRGGYRLARPADRITVEEVLAALDARVYERELCQRYTGDRRSCVHNSDCSIRSLWAGLQHMIDDVLSKVTLRDLLGTEQALAEWIQVHSSEIKLLPARRLEEQSLGLFGVRRKTD